MKTGLFFVFFCSFVSARVVLQGGEEAQQTAHSYALESLVMLRNLEMYTFYLIAYFSSLKHSKSTE